MKNVVGRLAGASALLVLFFLDWYMIDAGKMAAFDETLQSLFFALRDWGEGGPVLTKLFKFFTLFGEMHTVAAFWVVFVFLPLGLFIFLSSGENRKKHWGLRSNMRFVFAAFGLPVAVAAGLGGVIHTLIKHFEERPRPDEAMWLVPEDGFSFPSGHSNVSMILYVFIAVLVWRLLLERYHDDLAAVLRALFACLILLVGFSRIYLGVHYPSDVLGGWALGGALATIFLLLYDGPYSNITRTIPPVSFDAELLEE
ncbi:MAG: phosphatase PAP2 family protein [Clostridiales Family XIII bacterium]|nr:phosphatase PAP2 family protein [Clostridiales Family XIII bacterium]